MLDTRRSVETPEGVELTLRVAGPPVRFLALAIDFAIRLAVYFAVSIPLGLLDQVGGGVFLLVLFVGEWLYPVYFEVNHGGATPGKRAMGILVLHDDGTPVGWAASMLRNLIRFADFLPLAYGFGLMTMLIHRDFKRLGDIAAGTLVVHRERTLDEARVGQASPLPPPTPLNLDEQRAILDFAERLPGWTPQRAQELAGLTHPLTASTGQDAVNRLLAMANWLVGRR